MAPPSKIKVRRARHRHRKYSGDRAVRRAATIVHSATGLQGRRFAFVPPGLVAAASTDGHREVLLKQYKVSFDGKRLDHPDRVDLGG
jgi:hypothetical protein